MHELSIIMEILKIAEQNAQQNNLKKIKKIKLKVGKLRHLVPDIMTVAFQTARQDTLADQAKLEIEEISTTVLISQSIHGISNNHYFFYLF